MGESTCVIPTSPQEVNHIHALGQSISFGRFMSESLAWEKWSTFSHKKYVEEAERYSRPGSVAQKKAFFEAHYKKIAAKKAAEASNDDVQHHDECITDDNSPDNSSLVVDEKVETKISNCDKMENLESRNLQILLKKNLNEDQEMKPAASPAKSAAQIHPNKENNDPLDETTPPTSKSGEKSTNFTSVRISCITPESENKRTRTSLNSSTSRSEKGGQKSRYLATKFKKVGYCLCFKAKPLPDL